MGPQGLFLVGVTIEGNEDRVCKTAPVPSAL